MRVGSDRQCWQEREGRGTEGAYNGVIITVRFSEHQNPAAGPRQLRNTAGVEDPWLLFMDIWTGVQFLTIMNKVL